MKSAKLMKHLILLLLTLFGSYLSARIFSRLYLYLLPGNGGSFLDGRALIGLPLGYVFSSFFLFTTFGGAKKYLWVGILLLPVVLFELYFDFPHIYIPIGLGLFGWLMGQCFGYIITKLETKKTVAI